LAAAEMSYLGPFSGTYREELIEMWKQYCAEQSLSISDNYSLVQTLGN
jgi:dynein heavy chain, axonemal